MKLAQFECVETKGKRVGQFGIACVAGGVVGLRLNSNKLDLLF